MREGSNKHETFCSNNEETSKRPSRASGSISEQSVCFERKRDSLILSAGRWGHYLRLRVSYRNALRGRRSDGHSEALRDWHYAWCHRYA
jgi:hypothetical protein